MKKRVAALLCLGLPALAGEYAILSNGFRIYAERHEITGDSVRLHTKTGSVDMRKADVVTFEVEEYTAPPPSPPQDSPVSLIEMPLRRATPQELVEQAAVKHGLRPEFVFSVALTESAGRVDAVSPKGALGLMQLMPATASELGVDPRDPAQNAEAGARYLKQLLIKYAGSRDPVRLALAAYNAGPGVVDRYGHIPPYRETQQYVERVLRRYLSGLKSKHQL